MGNFDKIIRFFIYVGIFWLPYSSAILEGSIVLSFITWFIKRMYGYIKDKKEGKKISFFEAVRPVPTSLDAPIIIFSIIALTSSLQSEVLAESIKALFSKTLECFVVYYLVLESFKERKHFLMAGAVFIFTSLAVMLDAFFQFYMLGEDVFLSRPLADGRASASFKHPNSLGAYLAAAIPLFVSFLLIKKYRVGKTFFILLAFWAMLISFSRSAVFSSILGIFCFLTMVNTRLALRYFLVVFCATAALYLFTPSSMKRDVRVDYAYVKGTLDWRVGIWQDSFKMIKEKPVIGHGINTYMEKFREYRRKYKGVAEYSPTYAHNCYVQLWAETGALGLLAFLAILFQLIKTVLSQLKVQRPFNSQRILAAGLFSGIIAYLIHSFFDNHFYSLQLSLYFWIMAGMLIAFLKSDYLNQS